MQLSSSLVTRMGKVGKRKQAVCAGSQNHDMLVLSTSTQ